MNLYYLKFGRNIPNSTKKVTMKQVNDFCKDIVTKEFPGFGITHGYGYWLGVPEQCFTLEIVTDNEAGIGLISDWYKVTYNQDMIGQIKQVNVLTNF